MLIVPVRHHSPAAAMQVDRLIRERRPRVVLIEGPADADRLLPYLLDHATVPPVAIYAYPAERGEPEAERTNGRSIFFPLCDYSPEYAAMKAGGAVGATVRFCDLPAGVTLGWPEREVQVDPESEETAECAPDGDLYGQFTASLAKAAGFDTFDAFWEAAFEQACAQAPPEDFLGAFGAFGVQSRSFGETWRDRERDDLRERHMAAVAGSVVRSGVATDDVMLICGAAHLGPITDYFAAGVEEPEIATTVETELALVPYSYPRLSEQLGYGAGNRAPWYYQQVWKHAGDYDSASRGALVAVSQQLRKRGQLASLAQEIDAYELASVLAGMRGKIAPGVDEVTDAAVACYAQGQPAVVTEALRDVLIGDELGRVTPFAGRTPLQTEFYATAQRLGLPVVDAPRQILVHLPMPKEAQQSVFLHRLVAAEIPFGRELEGGIRGGGRAAQGGALAGLGRAREKWELCWTPSTDAGLVERNAWGSTLAEVCERMLRKRLNEVTRIDQGTGILLQLTLCELPDPFPAALARCEALAADSGSFPALARAVFHLDGLLAYGAARRLPEEQLADLAARLFVRAMLHLTTAAICADEAAEEVEQTLRPLAELVRRKSATAEPDVFWEAIEAVAGTEACHPGLRGLALTLMEVEGRLPAGELARRLRPLLAGSEAAANARLVAGVFSLHRSTLIRNRPLIAAVTEFLLELDIEELIPLLPALRRTLGDLSPAERRYLGETLGGVLGIDDGRSVTLNLSDLDRAILGEADAAVAATLADWKDRYGIE